MTENTITDSGAEYSFKVNGTQFETKSREHTARHILELAANKGVIPGKPDEYALDGEKDRYVGDDVVDLATDNIFITIPITPTPVA